jgi:acyl carrier protein
VKHRCPDQPALRSELKHVAAELIGARVLEPDAIGDDEPLAGGTLDLDSLDCLEIAMWVEEKFGIAIREHREADRAFATIGSLAAFIGSVSRPEHHRSPATMAF